LDSLGNEIWLEVYNITPNSSEKFNSLQNTDDGSLILSREPYGSVGLAKTDYSGNLLWSYTYGDRDDYQIDRAICTDDGGFALLSNTWFNNGDIFLIKTNDSGLVSNIEIESRDNTPFAFNLYQNHPNPFNPSTTIKFDLPKPENVKIMIYNTLGQEVETLLHQRTPAGHHEVEFNAKSLSSGLYYYYIQAGEFKMVKKMILLK